VTRDKDDKMDGPDADRVRFREERARIIREERDTLVLAWLEGEISNILDAENFLNRRIRDLGVQTVTGDSTE
jgi:hypothetical protein